MTEQLRPDGSLRHLLTLETLARSQIERLLERSQAFVRPLGARPARSDLLTGMTVANLFTEPSTRTRVSFELAARRLGATAVNLEVQLSSRVKGESMLDTVYTLQSLHVDALVIRDAEPGVPGLVAAHVAPHVSVLSGGEAQIAHAELRERMPGGARDAHARTRGVRRLHPSQRARECARRGGRGHDAAHPERAHQRGASAGG
jgi:aspartate carbamoyltransferase catalytic subunit